MIKFVYESDFIYLGRFENPEEDITNILVKRGLDEEEAHQLVLDANATDPTGEDYSYTLWLLKQVYSMGGLDLPNEEIKDVLEFFHKMKNKTAWAEYVNELYPEIDNPKDINQFNLLQLQEIALNASSQGETGESISEEQQRLIEEGIEELGDGVFSVENIDALLYFSRGTGWKCKGKPGIADDYLGDEGMVHVYESNEGNYLYIDSRDVIIDPTGRTVKISDFIEKFGEDIASLMDIDLFRVEPQPDSYKEFNVPDPYRIIYVQGEDEASKAALWYFSQGSDLCFSNNRTHNRRYAETGVYLVFENSELIAVWSPDTNEFHDPRNAPITIDDQDIADLLDEYTDAPTPDLKETMDFYELSDDTLLDYLQDVDYTDTILEDEGLVERLAEYPEFYDILLTNISEHEGNLPGYTEMIISDAIDTDEHLSAFLNCGRLINISPTSLSHLFSKIILNVSLDSTPNFEHTIYRDPHEQPETIDGLVELADIIKGSAGVFSTLPSETKGGIDASLYTLFAGLHHETWKYVEQNLPEHYGDALEYIYNNYKNAREEDDGSYESIRDNACNQVVEMLTDPSFKFSYRLLTGFDIIDKLDRLYDSGVYDIETEYGNTPDDIAFTVQISADDGDREVDLDTFFQTTPSTDTVLGTIQNIELPVSNMKLAGVPASIPILFRAASKKVYTPSPSQISSIEDSDNIYLLVLAIDFLTEFINQDTLQSKVDNLISGITCDDFLQAFGGNTTNYNEVVEMLLQCQLIDIKASNDVFRSNLPCIISGLDVNYLQNLSAAISHQLGRYYDGHVIREIYNQLQDAIREREGVTASRTYFIYQSD
jgi:hypothetical protein